MIRYFIGTGMWFLLISEGSPADLPSYPIEEWCEHVSQSVGGSYVIKKGCIQQEEQARRELREMRPATDRIQNWCHQVATQGTGSQGTYQIHLGCVKQEIDAAQ